MNEFDTARRFDRMVSVEMFEHMRNYAELLRRIASWSRPQALLFVHVFAHSRFAYPFEVRGPRRLDGAALLHRRPDAQRRPAALLSGPLPHPRALAGQWRSLPENLRGVAQPARPRRNEVLDVFASAYGKDHALRWLVRWRVFFMACAELFGYAQGQEWIVSHYLFEDLSK